MTALAQRDPPISGRHKDTSGSRATRTHYAAAGGFIALGIALRLWTIGRGQPPFDSDEGTMGLMALHINAHGDFPLVFYGQSYMGALEGYLAAPLFQVLGASDFTLRLGLVFLAAVFLILIYVLTTLVYDRRTALWTLVFTSVGSSELLARQLKADGGYPELLVFGVASMLVASYLSMTSPAAGSSAAIKRQSLYGLWGLTVGLGIWSDPLMLPFAAMSGLLLLGTRRRTFYGPTVAACALGLLLGLAPLIAYNLSTAPSQGTVNSVVSIIRSGGSGHTSHVSSPFTRRLAGLVAVSLPVISGGNGLCGVPIQDAWPLSRHSSRHTVACTVVHAGWGIAWLLCLLLAITGTVRSLGWRRRRHWLTVSGSPPDLNNSAPHLARLALLGTAVLNVALFMVTSAPAHAPWFNVRYLTGVWIAFPAMLAPVVRVTTGTRTARMTVSQVRRYGLVFLLGVALISNVVGTFGDASYPTWLRSQLETAAQILATHHVQHVYADYWTCDWLAFETHENITCAVINAELRPGLDRYPPYRKAVIRDPAAWYIFRADRPEAASFARMADRTPARYRRTTLSAFTLYQRLHS